MKKLLCLLLMMALILPVLPACAEEAATNGSTEPTVNAEEVLGARRQAVQDYMVELTQILWTCDQELFYYRTRTGEMEFTYKPGVIYKGLPYTVPGGSTESLKRYSNGPDENGVYHLTGLGYDEENQQYSCARLGNACSSGLWAAWAQVAESPSPLYHATRQMTVANGFLPVGDYQTTQEQEFDDTAKLCNQNGEEVMFAAYAQLQPGDGVVHYNGTSGHAMMVTKVTPGYDKKGNLLGATSMVIITDQSSGNIKKGELVIDEKTGLEVQPIGNTQKVLSFRQLFDSGYLPITCKELIDPAPVEEELYVKSPVESGTLTQVLEGNEIICTRAVNLVTVTVSDGNGNAVQTASMSPSQTNYRSFPLSLFNTEPGYVIHGVWDPESLTPGNYTLDCQVLSITGKQLKFGAVFTVE